jgi:hypothetical protein
MCLLDTGKPAQTLLLTDSLAEYQDHSMSHDSLGLLSIHHRLVPLLEGKHDAQLTWGERFEGVPASSRGNTTGFS